MERPVASAEQIRALWEELDRPGPEKLQVALRKKGFFAPSVKVLREHFFAHQSSRQVFQRPQSTRGMCTPRAWTGAGWRTSCRARRWSTRAGR